MPENIQKNRRSRNAKISEARLKKLVECFAADMTVKDTVAATKLSEPTVRNTFMAIRERLFQYGFMRVSKREGDHTPARWVFARKHRGVPKKFEHLYEAEFLHRAFMTKKPSGFQRFKANDPDAMDRVKKIANYNKLENKYDIYEELPALGKREKTTRPFDPVDYEETSTIIINEKNVDPHRAFFNYIWAMLLKYPL